MPSPDAPYQLTVTNAVGDGGQVVYTVNSSGTMPKPGRLVTITGCSPSQFNIVLGPVIATNTSSFAVLNPLPFDNAYVSGGQVTYSPTVSRIYGSVPDFIQQADAANNYLLYKWIFAMVATIDATDSLVRDNVNYMIIQDNATLGIQPAVGWSQILDINRCPTYALPWLAQFIGVQLKTTSSLSLSAQRTAWMSDITTKSSFNRGTRASLIAELVNVANPQLASNNQLTIQQVICMEQIQYKNAFYSYADYYVTLLIPNIKIPLASYADVENGNGRNVNPLVPDTYDNFKTIYPQYNNIPDGLDYLTEILNAAKPAGLILYLGGY